MQQLVTIDTAAERELKDAPVKHYKAYRPRPFTSGQRETTTILFGGTTWKHERLIQAVFQNANYKAEPLPNIQREDLDAGKELIDVGACCPTTFTTGMLVNFLKREVAERGREETLDKYLFLTCGSCGPCRFGQYQESYAMALDGLGLRDFRVLLMAQDELDQSEGGESGLVVNAPLMLGLVWSAMCGDMIADMEYATRPYEVVRGQTDAVAKESIELLYQAFRHRPEHNGTLSSVMWHMTTNYFTRVMREVKKKWDAIEVDRTRVKARVKITGEFWLQTHEGEGNYNIKRWLEQEESEVVPPPIAVWLHYLMHPVIRKLEKRNQVSKHPKRDELILKGVERLFVRTYNGLRKEFAYIPGELPDQIELKELAAPYFHFELRGGEGHMLIGKALHAYHHKKAHMICELSPYSCMPNTMSIGAMANVTGKYPDLLYAPIEVKGDAEVHALSRCQMVLTEAKKRAHSEFEHVLRETGLTVEAIRWYEKLHPELRRATYKVPHKGYAGMAANYVLHLAKDRGVTNDILPRSR